MFHSFDQTISSYRLSALAFAVVLTLILVFNSAVAHPPSNMELEYSGETGHLRVKITHRVGNPSNHYVEKISVFRNDNLLIEEDYSEQDASTGGDYEYKLDVQNGDAVEVRAVCNRFGNISRSITVKGVPYRRAILLAELTTETEVRGVADETPESASGLAVALLNPEDNVLEFSLAYKGLSGNPTMAHFHRGEKGEEGPPVKTIFAKSENESSQTPVPESNGGFISGVWKDEEEQPLDDELVDALLSGEIYINVHTELNPAGEIRAQLKTVN